MTTATQRLNIALVTMAANGERPRCADPVTRDMWTSDDQHDRDVAARWCTGCVVLTLCADAAEEREEKWHVHGGRDFTRKPRGQQTAA
jgi:hypothetical protein